jgi:hypothetical protein
MALGGPLAAPRALLAPALRPATRVAPFGGAAAAGAAARRRCGGGAAGAPRRPASGAGGAAAPPPPPPHRRARGASLVAAAEIIETRAAAAVSVSWWQRLLPRQQPGKGDADAEAIEQSLRTVSEAELEALLAAAEASATPLVVVFSAHW